MNSGAIVIAILAVVCVLLPILGIGPVIQRDSTQSQNNLLFVRMRPPEWYEAREQTYRATAAQEIAEWWMRWAVALPVASLTLFIDAGPYQWALSLFGVLVASLWSALFYGQLDLIGRAVEVLADGRQGYLEAEARRLRDGTRGTFRDQSPEVLAAMIRRRFGIARVLLWLLKRRIARL